MSTEIMRSTLISVVIKTLNEERRIGACIASALEALKDMDGEIILADSGSTDRTIEIASHYPICIVQLADISQRRCGIGPQLGYQFATGHYIYILDGDMELDADFLSIATQALESDFTLAGVAGLVEETSRGSVQFRGRKERNFEGTPGEVQWLDMGGLYRRTAIEQVQYFSNRNLDAHEEKELGLRLCAKGWRLTRLPVRGVRHYGHPDATLLLLKKRWRSGYLFGAGQIIRAAVGTPYFTEVLRGQLHLLLTIGLLLCLAAGIFTAPYTLVPFYLWGAMMWLVAVQRIVRHTNLRDGLLCIVVWHVNAIALVRGLLLPQVDPTLPVAAVTLRDNRTERSTTLKLR